MQMLQIRLIFLENDFIEQSCLMYLGKQVPFVNSNMKLFGKYHIQVGVVFSSYWTAISDVSQGDFFKVWKAAVRGQTNL